MELILLSAIVILILFSGLQYFAYVAQYQINTVSSSKIKTNFNHTRASQKEFTENDRELAFDFHRPLLSLKKLRYGKVPHTLPYISGDTMRAFADHIIDNFPWSKFSPEDVDAGDIIFVKTDFIAKFLKEHHAKILNPYILLTHNSDYSVCNEESCAYLDDSKLLVWYGENMNGQHRKLRAVPIGVYNNVNFSTLRAVSKNLKPFQERNTNIYVNFGLHTNNNRSDTLKYSTDKFRNDNSTYIPSSRSLRMDNMK